MSDIKFEKQIGEFRYKLSIRDNTLYVYRYATTGLIGEIKVDDIERSAFNNRLSDEVKNSYLCFVS